MKIAVIGAGISGLTIGRLLSGEHCVKIYEKDSRPGGMVKCDVVENCLFHRTGGHVFNTRRADVLDFFWGLFDREKEFTKARRRAAVAMPDGNMVDYPIENHVYQMGDDVLRAFIDDLVMMSAEGGVDGATNFEEFLRKMFGPTLYELYFRPYNEKVWRRDLSGVPLSWLEGKLPMPTIAEMIYNNIRRVEEQQFVHSSFYYPTHGGSQHIVDRLSQGLDIKCGTPIDELRHTEHGWVVDGEVYDAVVFAGNIKHLPQMLQGTDALAPYIADIERLESHGTTSVFCEIDRNDYSWIYQPSPAHESHRIICTGNFSAANNAPGRFTATIEFTDFMDQASILDNLKKIPYHPRYITHHYEKYTYPIQNADTRRMIRSVQSALNPLGLYLLGRFAQWEYYNMDAAMGAAIELEKQV